MAKIKKSKEIDLMRFLSHFHESVIDKDITTIRFVKNYNVNFFSGSKNITYGYFKIKDNMIVECERGYSQWKGYKLLDCKNVWLENESIRMKNIFTGEYC